MRLMVDVCAHPVPRHAEGPGVEFVFENGCDGLGSDGQTGVSVRCNDLNVSASLLVSTRE